MNVTVSEASNLRVAYISQIPTEVLRLRPPKAPAVRLRVRTYDNGE